MTAPLTLHSRFLEVVARRPDAPAIVSAGWVRTYDEVAARSAGLADRLREAAGPDDRSVALCLPRGEDVPVAILGALRAGLAYVPIDPGYPAARRDFLLSDCGAGLVVDDELRVSRVDRTPRPLPAGTAYVIYTSGSSGRPKGCMVGHEHVLALLDATSPIFGFGPDDVWTMFHSHSFDFSVWEMWGALLHGGSVVTVSAAEVADPAAMLELLRGRGVTVLNQTPSAFALLTREGAQCPGLLPDLRYIVFGGESVRPSDVQVWHRAGIAPNARIANMYGITETTVHVTHHWVDPETERTRIPIGPPLPHLEGALRDEDGSPVPDGEPGELWVGGSSVAYGYLGAPEETARRFRTDPGTGRRWYRSGDWAVVESDGHLYYLGRHDNQIKISGHRIELEEVEALLAGMLGIRAAACGVAVDDHDRPRLVAYLVPEPGVVHDESSVQQHIAAIMPRYMRPHRVRWVTRLPLTTNGKLDRSVL